MIPDLKPSWIVMVAIKSSFCTLKARCRAHFDYQTGCHVRHFNRGTVNRRSV